MKNQRKPPFFGETVVITGASSGIGKATAEAFAEQGADLVLAARGEEALQETAEVCRKLGATVIAVPTDTSVAEEVQHLVNEAIEFSGKIDYWVNNAGVLAFGKFEEIPVEVTDQIVKTNLLGYMHSAHAVLPVFKKQKRGVLLNNISIGGWMPAPYGTAYTASKYGVRGMVETLQGEVSDYPDIHICALYPGFQKSSGIEHAANYSGIKLSTPPPSFDPRKLAASIVETAKNPKDVSYPDWSAVAFKNIYEMFPGVVRYISSAGMRLALKKAHKDKNTSGNVLEPSKINTGINGKTLFSVSSGTLTWIVAGAAGLIAAGFLFSGKPKKVG
ncbi:short-chain dehydrogenase [Chryseobacterium indologenes]|uniref:SDR family oxidoreductase n=1 Tax=Chryseobacterium indologenes TaxID=253 RepID=UPI000BFE20A4|nr:SDR family oxidoreductase [Chryseobacterium indologenes]ATN05369.1 short-chain dehydrogenase [Chryseobacterium indologenes]AYY85872.1 SDR family oxidoreductase [Chryseobacterium indologenes]QIX82770.1 SDR family oxidoreductase [Chryseobacterium indologenes]